MNAPEASSTRPYLIRAMYEWCTDNGLTPYVAVAVDGTVQVPREYVNNNEIVLNISFDATSSLKLGNEFIEFKARFSGSAREIMVPIDRVIAVYARENGQGMSFPLLQPVPQLGAAAVQSVPPQTPSAPGRASVISRIDRVPFKAFDSSSEEPVQDADPLAVTAGEQVGMDSKVFQLVQSLPADEKTRGDLAEPTEETDPPNPDTPSDSQTRSRPALKRVK
jgi:stringent starvation protein B